VLTMDVDVYTQEAVPFEEETRRAFESAWADCAAGVLLTNFSNLTNDTSRQPSRMGLELQTCEGVARRRELQLRTCALDQHVTDLLQAQALNITVVEAVGRSPPPPLPPPPPLSPPLLPPPIPPITNSPTSNSPTTPPTRSPTSASPSSLSPTSASPTSQSPTTFSPTSGPTSGPTAAPTATVLKNFTGVVYGAGHLQGCTVMADQSEISISDAGGLFSGFATARAAVLHVSPGADCVDSILEEPLATNLSASAECTTISPLSTAAWEMARANNISNAEAVQKVKASLGLADAVDLCTGNALTEAMGAGGKRRALLSQADSLQAVKKGLVVLTTAMTLDALGPSPSSGFTKVALAAFAASSANSSLDLSNRTTVESLMADIPVNDSQKSAVSSGLATMNQLQDRADITVETVFKTAKVAQKKFVADVGAMATNNITTDEFVANNEKPSLESEVELEDLPMFRSPPPPNPPPPAPAVTSMIQAPPAPPPRQEKSDDNSLSDGMIVLITFLCFFFVVAVGMAVYLYLNPDAWEAVVRRAREVGSKMGLCEEAPRDARHRDEQVAEGTPKTFKEKLNSLLAAGLKKLKPNEESNVTSATDQPKPKLMDRVKAGGKQFVAFVQNIGKKKDAEGEEVDRGTQHNNSAGEAQEETNASGVIIGDVSTPYRNPIYDEAAGLDGAQEQAQQLEITVDPTWSASFPQAQTQTAVRNPIDSTADEQGSAAGASFHPTSGPDPFGDDPFGDVSFGPSGAVAFDENQPVTLDFEKNFEEESSNSSSDEAGGSNANPFSTENFATYDNDLFRNA